MEWKTVFEAGNVVRAVLLNLKRVLVTVCRRIFITKLEKADTKGKEKDWFISYLNNRFQAASYNGVTSVKLPTQFGVPHGSKLASLLFLIYINDINECFKYYEMLLTICCTFGLRVLKYV